MTPTSNGDRSPRNDPSDTVSGHDSVSTLDRTAEHREAHAPATSSAPANTRHENRKLGGYVATLLLYGLFVGVVAVLTAVTPRRLPGRLTVRDLVVSAAAAHKLSRTVTKTSVTRPLRAPFTKPGEKGGPGEVMDRPAGRAGLKHSIGELLTCPFCFDVWAITAVTVGRVFAPAATVVVVDALTALTGADFLHLAYARAQQMAEG
ncbi:DUF1360 domain-containing protein [Rhodococcus sp. DT1]|uniref:DUF1360 domain-containing protein n=1 Tax=unclassified Rhodococcus (in: high G+C Gram-positive bacteria) TaxID=192944 RepID=UPI003BB49AE4